MARQHGNNYIIGTFHHITYYKLREGYYLRTKSTLSKKRWQRDPAFAASRKRAVQFGEAVGVAKEIYHQLPKAVRQRGFMGKLCGQVHTMLLAGSKSKAAIIAEFLERYGVKKSTFTDSMEVNESKKSCCTALVLNRYIALSPQKDCRKIIEVHNSSLIAKSKVAYGSTFIVTLPVKQKEKAV